MRNKSCIFIFYSITKNENKKIPKQKKKYHLFLHGTIDIINNS